MPFSETFIFSAPYLADDSVGGRRVDAADVFNLNLRLKPHLHRLPRAEFHHMKIGARLLLGEAPYPVSEKQKELWHGRPR